MQLQEITESPEIAALEPEFTARSIDFPQQVSIAYNDVSRAPFVANDKDAWVKAILWKLEAVLAETLNAKPATTKGGKWARFFLNILSIFRPK